MPTQEEIDKQKADDAAAAAAANGGGDGGAGGGQSQDGQGAGGNDETITIKKSEYDKTLSDLDNYKKATVGDKNRPLPDSNNSNGGGAGGAAPDNKANGAGNGLTEEKVKEIVSQGFSQNSQKANEKAAKEKFYTTHPEYVESNAWRELVSHYSPKSGKDSVEDILNDLEDAVLAHKRRTGKLDEYFAQQQKEAERKAQIDAQVNMGHGAGGVGDRSNSGGGQKLTDTTIQMGRNFGHSQEQLEEVNKSIAKTSEGFVLDTTKPKVKK